MTFGISLRDSITVGRLKLLYLLPCLIIAVPAACVWVSWREVVAPTIRDVINVVRGVR